jgi:hypothetical protein
MHVLLRASIAAKSHWRIYGLRDCWCRRRHRRELEFYGFLAEEFDSKWLVRSVIMDLLSRADEKGRYLHNFQ